MGKPRGGNNRANQMNPNNNVYWQSRGLRSRPRGWEQQCGKSTQQGNEKSTKGSGTKE